MTLLRSGTSPNPLVGFTLDPAEVRFVGRDLQRPECILVERDGTLWAADARGGVMRIAPDGSQALVTQSVEQHFDLAGAPATSLLEGTLPNGLAFAADGDILISNFGTDRLERMSRSGETRVILDAVDGRPLGKVNFVLRDRRNRIWITVSTMVNPWSEAIRPGLADGYIVLLDRGRARIVADGFHFTNEIRLDASEEWLYVAETTAKRVTRLRVRPDGSLTDREIYGPADLGSGLVDGIAFDSYGNLWATMIFADGLVAITPEGELLEILADGDVGATHRFEAAFASGDAVPFETLMDCGGTLCRWMASVTFGGPDLKTVYLGGLRSTTIPYFQAPVAGLPMVHW
jgi:gluconolactonase